VPDSETVRVYFELGMAYTEVNGFESAVEEFKKVLAIPYEPKDIYYYYGKALTRTRDYDLGAEMLRKHVDWVAKQDETYATRVQDWELYQLLGDCYYYRESKDFYSAVQYYKKSLADRSDQKRIVQNVAIGLDRLGDYREALNYYNERIAQGMDSASSSLFKYAAYCALNLANAGATEGEELDDEAGEEAAPVVDTVDYNQLGATYLEQYLEFNSNDADVVMRLATTYYHNMDNCEKGVKWFERLAVVDPSNCEPNKWLGFAYFGGLCTKNYGKALTYLKKANDCVTASGKTDLDLMMWIAQAYHLRAVDTKDVAASKADYKSAFDWYNKVLKVDANNVEAKKGVEQTAYEY
jgi:tetratricopeptide (TPR) repeat protein